MPRRAAAAQQAGPLLIPTLDLRTLMWLALCIGLLGAWLVRRQQ
jgi:hypothetical protein